MNNPRFLQLATALRPANTSPEELMEALFIIRAPHSLAGIAVICSRLKELVERYPEVARVQMTPNLSLRLTTLLKIAEAQGLASHFGEGGLSTEKNTPLKPLTGDSGLCELLLMEPGDTRDHVHREIFERVLAWFAFQIFNFQSKAESFSKYKRYLSGAQPIRLKTGEGSKVYVASLVIRRLADPINAQKAQQFLIAVGHPNESDSVRASLLLRIAELGVGSKREILIDYAAEKLALERDQVSEQATRIGEVIESTLGLFLSAIWLRDLERLLFVHRSRTDGAITREIFKPKVQRWGSLTLVTTPVDEDGIQSGFAIDIFGKPNARFARGSRILPDEDPDDGDSTEPLVSVFLATERNLVRGFYSARSALHHIEAANAQLAWSSWRLSAEAIKAVSRLVVHHDGTGLVERRARLAIGLSLVTGRQLAGVVKVVIGSGTPILDEEHAVGICLDDYSLHVWSARPKLKGDPRLPELCAPIAESICLALPESWRQLIDSLARESIRRFDKEVVTHAKDLLEQLPDFLAVKAQGVAGALKLQLLHGSRGDLGLVKVVTDTTDINMQNIIHYSSYPVAEVEGKWRNAVEKLVGILPARALGSQFARVGSPQGFLIEKVRARIAAVRVSFVQASKEQRFQDAFNHMSIYTSLWCNLATAGRRSTQPVPVSIAPSRWAFVADKSRSDGSTDRLLPLTGAVLAQLDAYRNLAAHMGITVDELWIELPGDEGEPLIKLKYFGDAGCVPFRPKWMSEHADLQGLPGNWARKLVRSEAKGLSGRFMDAGLGLWVRGRHPWSLTSTFPSEQFKQEWLAEQARLERELGFEVLDVPGLKSFLGPLPCPKFESAEQSRPRPEPLHNGPDETVTITKEEAKAARAARHDVLREMLRAADPDLFERVFEDESRLPAAALAVVAKAVNIHEQQNPGTAPEMAKEMCDLIREERKIPIFAERPRARFECNWLVDRHEFRNYAYALKHFVPAFHDDIKVLPSPGLAPEAQMVELGRLVMISIWLLGLCHWSALDAFIEMLGGPDPVLAIGESRHVVLRVQCARTREWMRRTVFLGEFSSAYAAVERTRIRVLMGSVPEQGKAARYRRIKSALATYQRSLASVDPLSLSEMMAAARQSIMLTGSPLLAAYCSGEIFTEDLDDCELRRLNGLISKREGVVAAAPVNKIWQEVDVLTDVPGDVADRKSSFEQGLCGFENDYVNRWLSLIVRKVPGNRSQALLQDFAKWLVTTAAAEGDGKILSKRYKKSITNKVTVVGRAMLGFCDSQDNWTRIDDQLIDSLIDATAEHFSARLHHGAWNSFREYLAHVKSSGEIPFKELEIGNLGPVVDRWISAKILSSNEIKRIAARLNSARSGIGNPLNRAAAGNHFIGVVWTGGRRGEIAILRTIDVQADLVRLQPYDLFTFKTPAGLRVIPLAMLPEELIALFDTARNAKHRRVIDPVPTYELDGSNFFDAVNRIIKDITGDKDIGLHHLRHTYACLLILSVLASVIDLDFLGKEFEWVKGLLLDQGKLDVLLGGERGGHGLQAASALLGHLHPTTTLHHYVHVLCVALHALLAKSDAVALTRSFENRIASLSTVQRWAFAARKEAEAAPSAESPADLARRINNSLRNRLEREAEKLCCKQDSALARAAEASKSKWLVHHDPTPVVTRTDIEDVAPGAVENSLQHTNRLSFDRIESLDRGLRLGSYEGGDNLDSVKQVLRNTAGIASGSKGSTLPRHPMPDRSIDGTPMPAAIPSGQSVENAERLIVWLERLRADNPDGLRWLLQKWLYTTDAEQGLIRLNGHADVARMRGLEVKGFVEINIKKASISKARKRRGQKINVSRARILVVGESGTKSLRNAAAVRWVLTWVAVILSTDASLPRSSNQSPAASVLREASEPGRRG